MRKFPLIHLTEPETPLNVSSLNDRHPLPHPANSLFMSLVPGSRSRTRPPRHPFPVISSTTECPFASWRRGPLSSLSVWLCQEQRVTRGADSGGHLAEARTVDGN